VNLVVCGGSSLIAMGLVDRTTVDVDIVALLDSSNRLTRAEPLPDELARAGLQVARDLGLANA
jgi:hypothetical protein